MILVTTYIIFLYRYIDISIHRNKMQYELTLKRIVDMIRGVYD